MGKVKAVPQFSESISSFCKLMENAQRDYAWNYDEVNRMDKKVYLGRYAVKEEAILARLTKEVELYKEFSPQRELLESLNL